MSIYTCLKNGNKKSGEGKGGENPRRWGKERRLREKDENHIIMYNIIKKCQVKKNKKFLIF
jgi:hypothetical protein